MSLYQRSGRKPLLIVSVRSMAIGGAVYVYVGDREEGGSGKKKHPLRVLLSDIGYFVSPL